jgi:hypothetical protein
VQQHLVRALGAFARPDVILLAVDVDMWLASKSKSGKLGFWACANPEMDAMSSAVTQRTVSVASSGYSPRNVGPPMWSCWQAPRLLSPPL